jgi:hypothetical protein
MGRSVQTARLGNLEKDKGQYQALKREAATVEPVSSRLVGAVGRCSVR